MPGSRLHSGGRPAWPPMPHDVKCHFGRFSFHMVNDAGDMADLVKMLWRYCEDIVKMSGKSKKQ